LAGLAALVGAWVASSPHSPPLYDGVGFPDEPYRYVVPPPDYQHTAPPSTAQTVFELGGPQEFAASSNEQGPQVYLFLQYSTVRFPAGAKTFALAAAPEAPVPEPPDGTIDGNVYQVTGSTPAGPPAINSARPGVIQLRSPKPPPPTPVMEFYDGAHWQRISTSRVGNDIWAAPLRSFGKYAMVVPNHPVAQRSGGGLNAAVIVLIVVFLVLAGLIAGIRVSRRRRGAGDGT
jgi:hypothetical protein